MDLRYLEFLLTAYSWIAILLCGILIIWLIRLPITEINLLVVKVKTEISKHIMDGIVFVMLIVCLNPMNIIQHRITDEVANLRLQYAYQYSSDPDDSWRRKEDARRAAIKKQWEGLYDELTHSKNTAVF